MEWEFFKISIVGYGVLSDPKGKEYSVNFEDIENIIVKTTIQARVVKIPKKVHQMILNKITGDEIK